MHLHPALLTVAAGFVAVSTQSAQADDWICTYSTSGAADATPFSISLRVADGLLIEQPYDTRYRILENNDHAIVAEDHYADVDPVLVAPNIFITTVMIDKGSRRFTQTTALSGSAVRQWTGSCTQRFEMPMTPAQSAVAKTVGDASR